MLTPRRRRGVEFLDEASVDPAVRRRAQADVARSNWWLGGLRAATRALRAAARELPGKGTLLDVGTGLADIPARARHVALADGIALRTIGVDGAVSLLVSARDRVDHGVCADARALPFRDHSIDIVMCSQLLHHFEDGDAVRLLSELDRVARRVVLVSDIRRSWFAAIGFWVVSVPLRFHPVTRHDGFVSVLRGFTRGELERLVRAAAGVTPRVERGLGYRLTARWTPRVAGPAPGRVLGPMPAAGRMTTVDERLVRAPVDRIFALAADVEHWPAHLEHYRAVRFLERGDDGGGVVEMSANRPFGALDWPTWWTSEMSVSAPAANGAGGSIRYRHVRGITTGMQVEWSFHPAPGGTHVRITHVWNGPRWPLIGPIAARTVIGPVFVHGIAMRTLAGLGGVAEARRDEATSERGGA